MCLRALQVWMLDSFRTLDVRFLQRQGRKLDWVFLEVCTLPLRCATFCQTLMLS